MALTRGKWMQIRLYAVCLVFMLAFAAIMVKSYHLQVVDRDDLMKKAQRELQTYLAMGAVRGEIFDATGEKLAASLPGSSLHADPKLMGVREIKDEAGQVVETIDVKAEVARKLHETIGLDEGFVAGQLAKSGRYNELVRFLDVDQANAVADLKLPGLILGKTYNRTYPNRKLAANFLGCVGRDQKGLEGLELVFDERLKAGPDRVRVKRDASGRKMIDKIDGELEQSKGDSMVLTIDRRIQYITEKALANAVVKHNALSGMALVMRPKTGAIVASAVWPSYDPNEYKNFPESFRRNRVLTDTFEPGSTFKVFVVAAALEEGLINPSSIINCENGAMRVANHTVKDTHSYGDLTVSEVIKYSSNIGSLKVGGVLGNDLLYNYLTRFSFGESTGLGQLPGEVGGKLKDPNKYKWRQVEAANIAFGQGLTVTTLQMVMAMSSIANQGVLMKPYIVDRIVDEDGRVVEQYEPHILRQVVSPLTARQVSAMLRMAVQKGGTATRAEVAGYPVAGKTGTAQKVGEGSKSYTAGKYVSSFIGFAPYHDPQLTVMVVLNEPKNGYYGGTVAAPAFREIMENSLPLLDIPPTDDRGDPIWPMVQTAAVGAPGLVDGGQPTNFIRVKFRKNDRGAKGPITFASLSPEKALAGPGPEPDFSDSPLPVLSEPGVMPNLAGLSMRQVMEVMSDYGLDLEYAGSGHVVRQEPRAGTAVAAGQTASVIFER